MIEITVDDANVQRTMSELLALGRDSTPMMAEIAEYLVESTQARFRSGVDPDGQAWAPVKRGGRPLYVTGQLQGQIFPFHGRDHAGVASATAYAPYLQFGTRPHRIAPRSKKALAWPGGAHPVAGVNHPGTVARPFMGLSEADRLAIADIAAFYLLP